MPRNMLKNLIFLVFWRVALAAMRRCCAPASAEFFGCNDPHNHVLSATLARPAIYQPQP